MFPEIRRKERALDNEKALEMLENGEYGVLSTVGENGYAYGVPLNYVYIDGAVYFHCAVEGHKLNNMRHNDRVSFCVVASSKPIPQAFSTEYNSTILFGKAVEVEDDEKEKALMAIVLKYSSGYIEEGRQEIKKAWKATKVFKIVTEHISAKKGK